MARPVSADTANKIIIHTNANYFYATVAARLNLIFPQDWDLSEAEKLSGLEHGGFKNLVLILASYVRSVHKQNEFLRTKFGSIEDTLAEMRPPQEVPHAQAGPSGKAQGGALGVIGTL